MTTTHLISVRQDMLAIAGRDLSAVLLATYGPAADATAVLNRVGLNITNRVRLLSHKHGQGRVYTLHNPERTHQASAPDDPFATDIGRLSASYNWKVGKNDKGSYVDVGTADERGPWLEFGTSRMDARPTLRPAITLERDEVGRTLAHGLAANLAANVHAKGGT